MYIYCIHYLFMSLFIIPSQNIIGKILSNLWQRRLEKPLVLMPSLYTEYIPSLMIWTYIMWHRDISDYQSTCRGTCLRTHILTSYSVWYKLHVLIASQNGPGARIIESQLMWQYWFPIQMPMLGLLCTLLWQRGGISKRLVRISTPTWHFIVTFHILSSLSTFSHDIKSV